MVVGARMNRGTLEIVGTSGKDSLQLLPGRNSVIVSGTLGGASVNMSFSIYGMQRVVANLGGGNDSFSIDSRISLPVIVNAGAGNDTVRAGSGPAVLIGGTGQDQLTGGAKSDLLIAGTTAYDENPAALFAILNEWSSPRTLATRSTELRAGSGNLLQGTGVRLVANETVFDDGDVDTLMGGGDSDWFLFDTSRDKVKDKTSSDLLN
jgi:Ca2+-binding RTX toxin-like protein